MLILTIIQTAVRVNDCVDLCVCVNLDDKAKNSFLIKQLVINYYCLVVLKRMPRIYLVQIHLKSTVGLLLNQVGLLLPV